MFDIYGTLVKTVICHRRPLTPRPQLRGGSGQHVVSSVAQSTGGLRESAFNQGGLPCEFRPPPQLKGLRSGWTPPARTRRVKGNGHRTLPAAIFPVWATFENGESFEVQRLGDAKIEF